jgi:hypothetical protein
MAAKRTNDLEHERALFDVHVEEWRRTHLGAFVLIRADDVVGFFDSLSAAFDEGTKRYGLEPFFVQQIAPPNGVNVSFFGQRILAG